MNVGSVLVVEKELAVCILACDSADANPYGCFLEQRKNSGQDPSIESR